MITLRVEVWLLALLTAFLFGHLFGAWVADDERGHGWPVGAVMLLVLFAWFVTLVTSIIDLFLGRGWWGA